MTFTALMEAVDSHQKPFADTWHPAYYATLELVRRIDDDLNRGLHYRDTSGALLTTLDQVVNAILNDTLEMETINVQQTPPQKAHLRQQTPLCVAG